MNLQEFNDQVVKVTIKDLGDPILNKVHMITGFTSELLDELPLAITSDDVVNYYEELGDAEWFIIGAMNAYGIPIPGKIENRYIEIIEELTAINIILPDDYAENQLLTAADAYVFQNILIGRFNSILKKEVVSGVIKYNGEKVTTLTLQKWFHQLLCCIEILINNPYACIDAEYVAGKMLTSEQVREKIKNKLLKRHNNGAMTTETDLNRDLIAERQILES